MFKVGVLSVRQGYNDQKVGLVRFNKRVGLSSDCKNSRSLTRNPESMGAKEANNKMSDYVERVRRTETRET